MVSGAVMNKAKRGRRGVRKKRAAEKIGGFES